MKKLVADCLVEVLATAMRKHTTIAPHRPVFSLHLHLTTYASSPESYNEIVAEIIGTAVIPCSVNN